MSAYSNRLQPALQNLLQRVVVWLRGMSFKIKLFIGDDFVAPLYEYEKVYQSVVLNINDTRVP